MNKNVWKIGKRGNLRFPKRARRLNRLFAPDSKWEHPVAAIVVMLVCATLDFVVFKQLFGAILYDQLLIQWLSVIGCLVAFDLAPIYLGILLKKNSQGFRISWFAVGALTFAFVAVAVGNVWLRITVKDILVPDDSATASSIFSAAGAVRSNSPALPYAIVSSALPVATSAVSFIVSYVSSNPLKSKLKNLRRIQVDIEDDINQDEAILTEYTKNGNITARLNEQDAEMLKLALASACEQGFAYADYVRERISEHLGEAAAANELAKDYRDKLSALINEILVGGPDNHGAQLSQGYHYYTKEAA